MSGLVADYGSSSSSDDSEPDEPDTKASASADTKNSASAQQERLPLPSFSNELLGASVFSNPYRQAEDARRAVLEKHVKLTTAPEDLTRINGKKVCYNYRKGRCRFGRNCKFAHDSDLQRPEGEAEEADGKAEEGHVEAGGVAKGRPHAPVDGEPPRKKRPGLSQTLVPGKKVLNMYNATRKGPLV